MIMTFINLATHASNSAMPGHVGRMAVVVVVVNVVLNNSCKMKDWITLTCSY